MLSRRSLAFILASAIRRARALSCAAFHWSPDSISGRAMAEKIATSMATKMAIACMSAPTKSLHLLVSDGTSRRCPAPKHNQRRSGTASIVPTFANTCRILLLPVGRAKRVCEAGFVRPVVTRLAQVRAWSGDHCHSRCGGFSQAIRANGDVCERHALRLVSGRADGS